MPNNKGPCPRCGDTDLTTKDNCPLDLGCPHKHPDGYRPASPALSEETLLPCPFCGANADLGIYPETDDSPRGYFGVCQYCAVNTAMSSDKADAIAAWNRRPSTPDEREAIARIIDPDGWATRDRHYAEIARIDMSEERRAEQRRSADSYVTRSLAKADAILARRGPAPAGVGLAKFFQWAMDRTWEGCTLDGADTQGMALSLHLIREVPYDPEEHGPNDVGVEQGDTWFVFSPEVSALTKGAEHA